MRREREGEPEEWGSFSTLGREWRNRQLIPSQKEQTVDWMKDGWSEFFREGGRRRPRDGRRVRAIGTSGWRGLGRWEKRRQATQEAIPSEKTTFQPCGLGGQHVSLLSSVVPWEEDSLNNWPQWDYFWAELLLSHTCKLPACFFCPLLLSCPFLPCWAWTSPSPCWSTSRHAWHSFWRWNWEPWCERERRGAGIHMELSCFCIATLAQKEHVTASVYIHERMVKGSEGLQHPTDYRWDGNIN